MKVEQQVWTCDRCGAEATVTSPNAHSAPPENWHDFRHFPKRGPNYWAPAALCGGCVRSLTDWMRAPL